MFTSLVQIQLRLKCSRISVFGRICKMAHTNTAVFRISTSFEKLCSRCCHVFNLFVYFVEISPLSHDWWNFALWISVEFKQYHEQIINPVSVPAPVSSNPAKSGSSWIYKTWIRYSPSFRISDVFSDTRTEQSSLRSYQRYLGQDRGNWSAGVGRHRCLWTDGLHVVQWTHARDIPSCQEVAEGRRYDSGNFLRIFALLNSVWSNE